MAGVSAALQTEAVWRGVGCIFWELRVGWECTLLTVVYHTAVATPAMQVMAATPVAGAAMTRRNDSRITPINTMAT